MKINLKASVLAAVAMSAGILPAMESMCLDGLWEFRLEKDKMLEDVSLA